MITGVPPIIAADRRGHGRMEGIANHGTIAITRKARRMNGARITVGSMGRSLATIGGFSEPRNNRQHLWRPPQSQPWKKVTPACTVLFANNHVITQLNAQDTIKEKGQR